MNKKGAISLSMNFLVILIISIFILAGGIVFLYKFMDSGYKQKEMLDQRTTQELERLLTSQGQMVALPLNKATVSKGELHIFGVGIMNIGSDSNKFKIVAELSRAVNEMEEDLSLNPEEINRWLLYDDSIFDIGESEINKIKLAVDVPKSALNGEYYFNVRVYQPELPDSISGRPPKQYGNTMKIYVKVV